MKEKKNVKLSKLRKEIDIIDNKIIYLLGRRVKIARHIINLKKHQGLKIHDQKREKEILNRLKSKNLVKPSLIDKIWKALFENARKK